MAAIFMPKTLWTSEFGLRYQCRPPTLPTIVTVAPASRKPGFKSRRFVIG
ncbi:hypothetical protein [Stieleria varia]|nr:hypothetical protein [Stieleria varia]